MPGPLEASLTLFGSNIDHALQLRDIAADKVALVNADGLTRTRGAELLLRYRWQAVTFTGSYVHTDAASLTPTVPAAVPCRSRRAIRQALPPSGEKPGHARLGLEAITRAASIWRTIPIAPIASPMSNWGRWGSW
jgi:iron complex outermembrane receptor protein